MLNKKLAKHRVREALRKELDPDRRTLDLGCGACPLSRDLADSVGMDVAEGPGVNVVGDAHDLPFEDEAFEQILCAAVLEHLHTPTRAVAEMARVLKPEGRVVLSIPFLFPVHEAPIDFQRFTEFGLKNLFQQHFSDVRIEALFNEWQTIGMLIQRMAFQARMPKWRFLTYQLLARAVFHGLGRRGLSNTYANIARSEAGAFMTAGYLVIAENKKEASDQNIERKAA